MSSQPKSLHEINTAAIHILCQQMGLVNTLRFINQFTNGYGNYTEEKDTLFGPLTVEDIAKQIKAAREQD